MSKTPVYITNTQLCLAMKCQFFDAEASETGMCSRKDCDNHEGRKVVTVANRARFVGVYDAPQDMKPAVLEPSSVVSAPLAPCPGLIYAFIAGCLLLASAIRGRARRR